MVFDFVLWIGEFVDEICFLYLLMSKINMYGLGENFMLIGFMLDGFFSMGFWVIYVFGSENCDFFVYVVIFDLCGML